MREKTPYEVLVTFLKLGVTAFGGPIAHIGYFREELVVRRRWVEDAAYSDLVALCQFLPGPSSSQVGFSLGLIRAGYWGGLAAWTGFTLPSAVFMTACAIGAESLAGPRGEGLLHGLKLVAVAIVAQAVWGMARTLCPDPQRAAIGALATLAILAGNSSLVQLVTILAGALLGLWLCRAPLAKTAGTLDWPVSRLIGIMALGAFFLLLAGLPLLRTANGGLRLALFDAFYRSGALVFGGGHVVLPLLRDAIVTPGWVSDNAFLTGYGAAQAVPGPLFTFAAYLGALAAPAHHGLVGAVTALVAIFLPGILVLVGAMAFWTNFRSRADTQAMMRGVNAAVVGLLAAALYAPVWTDSVTSGADAALALIGFLLLTVWRMPPVVVVAAASAAGIVMSGSSS